MNALDEHDECPRENPVPSGGDGEDPFDQNDDDCFKKPSDESGDTLSSQVSPVTSPESGNSFRARHYSISLSSSQSSTASAGRAALSCSRRLNSTEGLTILRRSIELLHLSKDLRVVQQSIRTIRELMGCDFVTEKHISGRGVVEAVCSLLKAHSSISSLTEEVCRFLAVICGHSREARDITEELDGVENLRLVLETHFELYSSTVDAAMRALGILCKHSHTARTRVRESRTLEWILVCVRQWRDARPVQSSALICLDKALGDEAASAKHAVALGVFQELLYTMHRFQEDSTVLHRAMWLLATLTDGDDKHITMSASEGAIERVIHALQYFPGKTEVVASASRASLNFVSSDQCRSAFNNGGGVPAVLGAVREIAKREREVGSQVHLAAILGAVRVLVFAWRDPSCRWLMCQPANVSLVMNAAAVYEHDEGIAESVSDYLCNLSGEDNHLGASGSLFMRSRLAACVVEQIVDGEVKLLSAHAGSARVAAHACSALANICSQGRIKVVRRRCPALLARMQEVVERHPSEDDLVNTAVSLVMTIR